MTSTAVAGSGARGLWNYLLMTMMAFAVAYTSVEVVTPSQAHAGKVKKAKKVLKFVAKSAKKFERKMKSKGKFGRALGKAVGKVGRGAGKVHRGISKVQRGVGRAVGKVCRGACGKVLKAGRNINRGIEKLERKAVRGLKKGVKKGLRKVVRPGTKRLRNRRALRTVNRGLRAAGNRRAVVNPRLPRRMNVRKIAGRKPVKRSARRQALPSSAIKRHNVMRRRR